MKNAPYKIIGIGAPLCDQIVHVSDEFLKEIHAQKGEMVVIEHSELKELLAKVSTSPIIVPGGSAVNVIKGLAQLRHPCALVGNIGDDALGAYLYQGLEQLEITPLYTRTETPTGQVICLITPDGERTFRVYTGASIDIDYTKLNPDLFRVASLVHIEGYALRNVELVEWVMDKAKRAGALISFDVGNFKIANAYRDKIFELSSKYVNILFANASEAGVLLSLPPKEACAEVGTLCDIGVVTMGIDGCWVGSKGGLSHMPAFATIPVDSTGAGDLFTCGFLHGFLSGKSLDVCAGIGSLIAAEVVKVHGASLPQATWEVLRDTIQAQS